jgi:flagellar assembly factor FliW
LARYLLIKVKCEVVLQTAKENGKMSKTIDFSKSSIMEIGRNSHCVVQEVRAENVFTFSEGILGFEDIKEYVFLLNEKVAPFMFMQALNGSNISFVCVETFLIKPDYSIKLPEANVELLELESPKEALILSLVTVNANMKLFTANLMSPIIINMAKSKGQQFIPDSSIYPVKYNIWKGIEKMKKTEAKAG